MKRLVPIAMFVLAGACEPARYGSGTHSLTERLLDEELGYQPSHGREVGLHDYDGRISDYSAGGTQRLIAMLEQHRRQLADAGYGSPDQQLDVALMRWQEDEQLFWLKDTNSPARDPGYYEELFSVSGYLDRDYAPFEDRFRHLVEHEEAALLAVGWGRQNLKPPLPKPLVDVAIGIYEGYADYLRTDVVRQTAEAKDLALKARFGRANTALANEAEKLAVWLKTVPTDNSHVLGPARFERLVEIYAGEKMSLADFEKMGEADLAKNRALYDQLAPTTKQSRPKDALAAAKVLTADARQFVVDHHILTMPREDRAEVVETPPFLRYNFAWLDAGGPYEHSTGAFFYVTPPDPKWSAEQQEEYIPFTGELRSTCVHEVYPGHFLQAGFLRSAPSRVQKTVASPTFVEGWAHYAEQMMTDEGFGADAEGRLGQVTQALLRDCRFLVALGIHAKGMSIADAEQRMIKDCHQASPVAKQQALRGAFHPWYFAYTLGKLQILALREEAKRAVGASFRLQAFHDALLSHGQGPVGLIRARVLADLGAPADLIAHPR